MTDTAIACIARALAEWVDAGRVLRRVAHDVLSRTATSHLLLAAMLEGQLTPLVAIGSPHPVLFEVSRDAFSTGRAAHRSDPALGLAAMAVPVRSRGAVVAVLAVAGGTGARGLALEPHAPARAAGRLPGWPRGRGRGAPPPSRRRRGPARGRRARRARPRPGGRAGRRAGRARAGAAGGRGRAAPPPARRLRRSPTSPRR